MSEKKPFESFIGPDESTRIMSALHHRISESCSARRPPPAAEADPGLLPDPSGRLMGDSSVDHVRLAA